MNNFNKATFGFFLIHKVPPQLHMLDLADSLWQLKSRGICLPQKRSSWFWPSITSTGWLQMHEIQTVHTVKWPGVLWKLLYCNQEFSKNKTLNCIWTISVKKHNENWGRWFNISGLELHRTPFILDSLFSIYKFFVDNNAIPQIRFYKGQVQRTVSNKSQTDSI